MITCNIKFVIFQGSDIIPMYFFGNTSSLSVLNSEFLANFSRKFQVSITLFWGWFGLPVPRPNKLLYVRGKPLGMPFIAEPSQVCFIPIFASCTIFVG